MMRQIYSNAESVSVWLGGTDDSCYNNVAMDYLTARKTLFNGNLKPGGFWNERQARGVLALCERNYWRRIWIVQEIMLAREATIYCGSKAVSWQMFEGFVNNLQALSKKVRYRHYVSSILDSPAIIIAKAKSEWDRNPQPLTTLLQLYHDHEATDIRDKIYALHGLAEDSLDIVVDYHKSIKDLHVEVLYYVCASRESSTGREWLARELVCFGKLIAGMLGISCSGDEIKFHICMASRGTHEMPSIRSSSSSTPTYIHQYSNISNGLTYMPGLRQNRYRTPGHECSFKFPNCSFVSQDAEQWKTHCQSHFRGKEPSKTVECPLCDFQYTSEDGWAAWNRRVEHFKVSHHDRDLTALRFSPPEFSLFKHMWRKCLIRDQDLEEPKSKNHSYYQGAVRLRRYR
jgi:hypothetical protein